MKFFGLFAAVAAALALAGCSFPSASLRADARPGKAILIYGLDATNGPVSVAIAPVKDGTCSGQTEARNAGDPAVVKYFAFEVPAGTYALSIFGTQGVLPSSEPAAFVVPAGRKVLIGTFIMGQEPGALHLMRDLRAAKAEIGEINGPIELAEVASMTIRRSASAMCSL